MVREVVDESVPEPVERSGEGIFVKLGPYPGRTSDDETSRRCPSFTERTLTTGGPGSSRVWKRVPCPVKSVSLVDRNLLVFLLLNIRSQVFLGRKGASGVSFCLLFFIDWSFIRLS